MTPDHTRPDVSTQRATIATALAVLASDPEAAHEAAGSGSCDACTVVSAVQFGFALAARVAGQPFVTGELHARLLAIVQAAEDELRGASS